ncbi:MAG: ubiquinone biosynthesis O-methyltransferase [Candidatus Micrarchaeota archaeon]|nr:MAG: ubiquinone biosynthesis O-methyltransferase [Candidatus Micrarchaeota archaeon]
MSKADLYDKNDEKFNALTSHMYGLVYKLKEGKEFERYVTDSIISIAKQMNKKLSILDVGFGPFILDEYLYKRLKESNISFDLYGVEPSESMYKIAIKRAKKLNADNIWLYIGSCRTFNKEIDSMRFDIIFMTLVFHHIEKKKDCIENLINHLNENGLILIYEFNRSPMNIHTMSYEKLSNILKDIPGIMYDIKEEGVYTFSRISKA